MRPAEEQPDMADNLYSRQASRYPDWSLAAQWHSGGAVSASNWQRNGPRRRFAAEMPPAEKKPETGRGRNLLHDITQAGSALARWLHLEGRPVFGPAIFPL
jgi:hypothetical protein